MMYGPEKSDPVVVAGKPTNKAERFAAELAEPRTGTKGNADQLSTCRTQSQARVSQALNAPFTTVASAIRAIKHAERQWSERLPKDEHHELGRKRARQRPGRQRQRPMTADDIPTSISAR